MDLEQNIKSILDSLHAKLLALASLASLAHDDGKTQETLTTMFSQSKRQIHNVIQFNDFEKISWMTFHKADE